MDSSIDDDATTIHADTPWRDIFLTIFVASAAVYIFFHKQTTNSTPTQHTLSGANRLNEDERSKRRERMAAIAEERAAAVLKAQQEADLSEGRATSIDEINNDGSAPKDKKQQQPTPTSSNTIGIGKHHSNSQAEKNGEEQQKEEKMEKTTNTATTEKISTLLNADNNTKVESKEEKCGDNCNSTSGGCDAVNAESTAKQEDDDDDTKKKEEEARARHEKAIAKIMAGKQKKNDTEQQQQTLKDTPTLKIYLILTASPGSPRIELSIPSNISARVLTQQISQKTTIPQTNVKLIFRGRIITTTDSSSNSSGKSVVDEYGIENGSALHVMGKPTTTTAISQPTNNEELANNEAADPEAYEDTDWNELPNHIQGALTTLGWTPDMWDDDDDGIEAITEDLYWDQLSREQQLAAAVMGYNEQSWNVNDSDDSSSDSDDSSDDSDDEPWMAYDDMDWDELPQNIQEAATTLGWTQDLWDNDDEEDVVSTENMYWRQLSREQQGAATLLGYNPESWNDDTDTNRILNYVVQQSEDLAAGEYDDMAWDELPADIQEAASAMGRNEQAWNGDGGALPVARVAHADLTAAIRRSTGQALYHTAAREGDLEILREAEPDILHIADANDWTVLHEAVRGGHTNVVEYLVNEVGLDINAVTNQEYTPLSLAIEQHGREHPVTILVERLLQQANNPPIPVD